MKWASPTATMNVSTEVTGKVLELSGLSTATGELGVHSAAFCVLELGGLKSSKMSLWRKKALVTSSKSASI